MGAMLSVSVSTQCVRACHDALYPLSAYLSVSVLTAHRRTAFSPLRTTAHTKTKPDCWDGFHSSTSQRVFDSPCSIRHRRHLHRCVGERESVCVSVCGLSQATNLVRPRLDDLLLFSFLFFSSCIPSTSYLVPPGKLSAYPIRGASDSSTDTIRPGQSINQSINHHARGTFSMPCHSCWLRYAVRKWRGTRPLSLRHTT
ncbi:hypothetical protein LX32DRAFT_95592 [Colletotrichum zoysiae]|uniref:Uncharacterized protein n=1 Tax=Colletotrichum zoysiae TaxID=1216348 RepID=A0AAD9LXM5_9PEZI|nr:hypothetical protein LX32DRAFT_95592 [Colletotrichum zoysiae]